MSQTNLEQLLLEKSSKAVEAARQSIADAITVLERQSAHSDPAVRLTVISCVRALIDESSEDHRRTLSALCVRMLNDRDEQVASAATMILYNNPPAGMDMELRAAFAVNRYSFCKTYIPMIASFHADAAQTQFWEANLTIEDDPDILGGIHSGLARMGFEPSRVWFRAKLESMSGGESEDWFDRSVKLAASWVYPAIVRCLNRTDDAYTAAADFRPIVIRIMDLAAWTLLTMTGEKVDFIVAKRRYLDTEIAKVREIAAKLQ